MKTKKELEGKVWYRILKVLFIILFIFSIMGILVFSYNDSHNVLYYKGYILSNSMDYIKDSFDLITLSIINICLFILIRNTFYYIVLGKFRPKD
ncbi:MAG: hypothetical protein WCO35_01025 [Candidatus Nomurabacteria bacterium]